MVKVGVLTLQGDFLEHLQILKELPNIEVLSIKNLRDLNGLNALIIPGGEPTAIGFLMKIKGLDIAITDFVKNGGAVMATGSGIVLLAKNVKDRGVEDTKQFTLKLMNITVLKNAFGRQRNSFITKVLVEDVGEVDAVFVRAPAIIEVWGEAKIIASINHPTTGKVGVAAIEKNMLALSFNPEISKSITIYNYFLNMVKK